MTLPRILSIGASGLLRQQPAPEFETLRGVPISLSHMELTPGVPASLSGAQGDSFELMADILLDSAAEAGFDLRCSADGKTGIAIRSLVQGH